MADLHLLNMVVFLQCNPDVKCPCICCMLNIHLPGSGSVCYYTFNNREYSCTSSRCLGPRVQILPSAEEHNLSLFDLNIACLCQSIEINNNKYVYRQSQVRISTDIGAKWAECSLIIGTGCQVQVFSLILECSVSLSASIQSAGDLVSGAPGPNPAFSRGTQLVSFRFEYRLPVPEHRN